MSVEVVVEILAVPDCIEERVGRFVITCFSGTSRLWLAWPAGGADRGHLFGDTCITNDQHARVAEIMAM